MSLLREYIRELLKEGALGVDALVEKDVYVTVSKGRTFDYTVYYSDKNSEPKDGHRGVYGEVTIDRASKGTGPCDGAFIVVSTMATKGWGPMLYDVAMEVATQNGNGLTPDRRSVSNAAQNVWSYYFNDRGDVQSYQLDLTDIEAAYYTDLNVQKLTPDIEEDDCLQKKTINTYGDKWDQSPLSKRYTKPPTTLNKLRAAGRLIEK
jgi:hypothetical protein